MDAQNVPVRRQRKETVSGDFPMGQKPDIDLPEDRRPEVPDVEAVHAEALLNGQPAKLAFNEEAIEIIIYPSQEANAPTSVPCWVNGRGAEVFINGGWHALGYLPVGKRLITRRKFAEVLLSAKRDMIKTVHEGSEVERPNNRISRISSAVANIVVTHDANPKGVEWIRRLMGQPG